MPILVHLADEREAGGIKKNGIKIGKYRQGIYCMPVLQNFYVSHQWLRELKRNGVRTYVGVYFRLNSKELVFAGKYNEPHKQISLGEAIKEIRSLKDPLGYELILNRKIEATEVEKIKILPQNIGWRYFPNSHTKRPACACPVCIPYGEIKGKRLRDKLEPPEKPMPYKEALEKLKVAESEKEIESLLNAVNRTRRRADPKELLFLLERKSASIHQSLAITLAVFRHKNTRAMLLKLLASKDADTKEYATQSLLKLYGKDIEKSLREWNDPVVTNAVDDWQEQTRKNL